ncbi:hypothetical protein ACSBR2_027515 [Camellia fascicularis]
MEEVVVNEEAEAMFRGQAEIFEYILHTMNSTALKCAVDLRIADIIHARGCPITFLAPFLNMSQYHTLLTAPFYFLSKSIREGGGNAFHKAHGRDLFDFASVYPEINKVFNDGMECTARITIKALISEYKHGLDSIGSPVDVGDGRGAAISKVPILICHVLLPLHHHAMELIILEVTSLVPFQLQMQSS